MEKLGALLWRLALVLLVLGLVYGSLLLALWPGEKQLLAFLDLSWKSVFAFNFFACELLFLLLPFCFFPCLLSPTLKVPRTLFIACVCGVHTAQFFSLFYSRDFLSAEILLHASLLYQLLSPSFLLQSLLLLGGFYGFLQLGILLVRSLKRRRRPQLGVCFLLVYSFLANGHAYNLWFLEIKRDYPVALAFPSLDFLQQLKEALASDIQPGSSLVLTPIEQASLRQRGLPGEPKPYPLVKDKVFAQPLPFPVKGLKPNVIVFFVESLSARLLENYGGPHRGLTPFLQDFASEATTITEYYNHTFPTVNGLKGQLCSIFPYFRSLLWQSSRPLERRQAFGHCLPAILNKHGYESLYFGYAHPHETSMGQLMLELGFSKRYFYRELLKAFTEYEEPGHAPYGNSDGQMVDAAIKFLKTRQETNPFFLVISTIETHPGLDVLNPARRYQSGESPVLNRFHNFDYEFGRFFAYFKTSGYLENTILILTADHAHAPEVAFRRVAGKGYTEGYFDPIVFMIFSRSHNMQRRYQAYTSSLDFAPTLLHLLQIKQERNHFLGRSIFDGQRGTYEGLGMVYGRHFLRISPRLRELSQHSAKDCDLKKDEPEAVSCHLYRGALYFQELIYRNQLWPELSSP